MYQTPKAILPKFLWILILEYLPIANIYKLDIVNKHFDDILNDDDWKQRFLYKRSSDIAIVKCSVNRMDHFWKYAYGCYITCGDFSDISTSIEIDNKANASKLIYYKVFIKAGTYNPTKTFRDSHYTNYSIEIIGCKNNPCIINYIDSMPGFWVISSHYFSIKYIVFSDNNNDMFDFCGASGYNSNYPNISKLHLSNCTFKNNIGQWLCIRKLYDVCVSNCIFESYLLRLFDINKLRITGCTFSASAIAVYHQYPSENNYIISHNVFYDLSINELFNFDNGYANTSLINIANNSISNADILCTISSRIKVIFRNNIITNIKSCIGRVCNEQVNEFVFDSNIFTNVEKLNHTTYNYCQGKLYSNNTFNNCGNELTQYIE